MWFYTELTDLNDRETMIIHRLQAGDFAVIPAKLTLT